jgi:hypothetical protein
MKSGYELFRHAFVERKTWLACLVLTGIFGVGAVGLLVSLLFIEEGDSNYYEWHFAAAICMGGTALMVSLTCIAGAAHVLIGELESTKRRVEALENNKRETKEQRAQPV